MYEKFIKVSNLIFFKYTKTVVKKPVLAVKSSLELKPCLKEWLSAPLPFPSTSFKLTPLREARQEISLL